MQFIQKHEIRIKRPSFCKAHFYTLKQFSLCGGVITMKPCISWSAFHNIGNHFWLSVVTLSIFFLYFGSPCGNICGNLIQPFPFHELYVYLMLNNFIRFEGVVFSPNNLISFETACY